ncbi:unnamed protein product [Rotaria sp. Silwood2]|nr:unnamed protein product [Rotaria sp. Silwood2]
MGGSLARETRPVLEHEIGESLWRDMGRSFRRDTETIFWSTVGDSVVRGDGFGVVTVTLDWHSPNSQ